jgi:hypothetical protein
MPQFIWDNKNKKAIPKGHDLPNLIPKAGGKNAKNTAIEHTEKDEDSKAYSDV